MVNEKQTKRERNIKSKLMAAIAMLLVSSIMMVSTTYAWFTLSTAPEVTGITTTVASNGNLEIALSPIDGMGANVGNATTATTEWAQKNLTWGNLVDMNHDGKDPYGLGSLTLAPAQLALTGAAGSYTLSDNVLATPVYGSDGRISGLNANAFVASKNATDGKYYLTDNTAYGVRAVGTASGMSPQEQLLRTSLNAITSNAEAAISAISGTLVKNGDALAAMLVTHAQVPSNDTNNYAQYVPAVKELADGLGAAIDYINEAIRAMLSTAIVGLEDTVNEDGTADNKFTNANNLINGKDATTGEYLNTVDELLAMADKGFTVPEQVQGIIDARNAISTIISNSVSAAETLMEQVDTDGNNVVDEGAKAEWDDVSAVLDNLMKADTSAGEDIDGDGEPDGSQSILVNGLSLYKVKVMMDDTEQLYDFAMSLGNNAQIQLGEGSGVYYDIAKITGNISAKVPTVPVEAMGIKVNLKDLTIKTNVSGTALLPAAKAAIDAASGEGGAFQPVSGSASKAVDTNYGYVIDLMVRTNAENSSLLLQTDPAQRVYGDSTNTSTQGKGASIVFTTESLTKANVATNLLNSIRVAFFDPSHGNAVFGLAKVTTVNRIETPTGNMDENNNEIIAYTITGYLELCQINVVAGVATAGEVLDSAVLCTLTQNVPQAISAMVYLDGENVTSSDVLADENVTTALNLQFASSAELKPMMNSDLYSGGDNGGAQTPPAEQPDQGSDDPANGGT